MEFESELSDEVTTMEWDAPVSLSGPSSKASFPLGVYPQWVRDMVSSAARFTQTDPTMSGSVVLSVLSACVAGRIEVEAKPGWVEPTNLYMATIAEPGERKSPVHSELTKPLRMAEKELQQAAGPATIEQAARKEIAERAAEKTKADAAKASPEQRNQLIAEAVAAVAESEAIKVDAAPRLFTDDSTPEALTSLLAAHGGRFAILSDEGGTFDILAGRYSANPNLDAYLKGHAGTPMSIDRKGRESERIDSPALTIGITAQPSKLRKFGGSGELTGNGMVARFLFAIPTSLAGYRVDADALPIPPAVRDEYQRRIRAMAIRFALRSEPQVVTLSTEAQEIRQQQADNIERQLRPGGQLREIKEWANKLNGTTVRIAGVLHMATHPDDGEEKTISGDTMNSAVELARFFVDHFKTAMDSVNNNADDLPEYVVRILVKNDMREFTRRELHRKVQRRLQKVDQVTAVLSDLTDLGWIRNAPAGGYELHPQAASNLEVEDAVAALAERLSDNTAAATDPRIRRLPAASLVRAAV